MTELRISPETASVSVLGVCPDHLAYAQYPVVPARLITSFGTTAREESRSTASTTSTMSFTSSMSSGGICPWVQVAMSVSTKAGAMAVARGPCRTAASGSP